MSLFFVFKPNLGNTNDQHAACSLLKTFSTILSYVIFATERPIANVASMHTYVISLQIKHQRTFKHRFYVLDTI